MSNEMSEIEKDFNEFLKAYEALEFVVKVFNKYEDDEFKNLLKAINCFLEEK